MHMDISQGNFYARIYSKKAGQQMEHPDLTAAFNAYRKNPSVWTQFREKQSPAIEKTLSTPKENKGPSAFLWHAGDRNWDTQD